MYVTAVPFVLYLSLIWFCCPRGRMSCLSETSLFRCESAPNSALVRRACGGSRRSRTTKPGSSCKTPGASPCRGLVGARVAVFLDTLCRMLMETMVWRSRGRLWLSMRLLSCAPELPQLVLLCSATHTRTLTACKLKRCRFRCAKRSIKPPTHRFGRVSAMLIDTR